MRISNSTNSLDDMTRYAIKETDFEWLNVDDGQANFNLILITPVFLTFDYLWIEWRIGISLNPT